MNQRARQQLMSAVVVSLVFGACSVRAHGIQKEEPRPKTYQSWDDASRQSTSPEEVCKAVKGRVRYLRHMFKEDEKRSSKEIWDKGEGNCEDYAVTVMDLCAEKSLKADMYIVHSNGAQEAHAVAVGESNGTIWISSNGSYEEVQSMREAKEKLARDLGWWAPDVNVYKVEKSSTNNNDRILNVAAETWR